jgi:L-threonylcarbamoyladenylate synthase
VPELSDADVAALEACVAGGGVALLPTDTVYGLCCAPDDEAAIRRLYELKGRPASRPAAIMFFSLRVALASLPELQAPERAALRALLPGALTLLLPNRAGRYPLACSPPGAESDALGLRVPALPRRLAALSALTRPVMQSSANRSGAADARTLAQVPPGLRARVDLELDGGELPGTASTVLDLRCYATERTWRIVREGPVGAQAIEGRLARAAAGGLC